MDRTSIDDESVVGDECHIVSGAPDGPRCDPAVAKEQLDDYSNLLLLCKVHHKLVDDQESTYSSECLRDLKANHERWIAERLESSDSGKRPVRIREVPGNASKYLRRIGSGKELLAIVANACAYSPDYDELGNEAEFDLVSRFLQNAQDWGELGPADIGHGMRAARSLDESLKELEQSGFWVFGCREDQLIEGGEGPPSAWPVAHLRVVRSSNAEIVRVSENDDQHGE